MRGGLKSEKMNQASERGGVPEASAPHKQTKDIRQREG